MTKMTWVSIAEQLRTIGVEVPRSASCPPKYTDSVQFPDSITYVGRLDTPDVPHPANNNVSHDKSTDREPIAVDLSTAKAAGVNFFEVVSDGDMVAEGLSDLSPDLRKRKRSF
jgi:hypothetical protein